MQLLWDHAPLTAAQIADRLAAPNGWSPKTVMTLIHRLVKKGAVAYDKQGRAHLYRPKLRQSQ
ncbi:MAG: BlaI/MecI/CopY family transcriptional regulator, partial [Burkholderiales bacterium]|nr:BlaI/MecI/CopY family transcriptional regulator [Burkholderiales bacterium]